MMVLSPLVNESLCPLVVTGAVYEPAGGTRREQDSVEQNDRHGTKHRQQRSGAIHDGMRKPRTDASNAFQKHKHADRDAAHPSATWHDTAEHKGRSQRREREEGAPLLSQSGSHIRSQASTAAPEQSSAAPAGASAGAANLSAAAQLKARLRGVPAVELATISRTVCHLCTQV